MTRRHLNIGISCYPTYGGSGVVATEIGMAMARRGHRVHFISYDVPMRLQRFRENVFYHEVEVQDYPLFNYPPYSLSLACKMVEVSEYENLDILHVHYAVPHATSAYLAKQILGDESPKVITTLHGTDITLVGTDRSYLPITRFSIIESDGVTAPSNYLKHATIDKLNVSSSTPIEVIPNFVDTEVFRPRCAEDLEELRAALCSQGCDNGSGKIISHVSNFRPVKRLEDLVRAFSIVCAALPAHLVLVGDGPERSKIEHLVDELGIRKAVCFLGKQDSFVPVLQASHLFMLPSESESFGLSALEAMSCGVPVIASDTQGIPEVVVHGETGYLSPVGAVEEMAANALELLRNPEKHEEFSKAARLRAANEFPQERHIASYEEYYYRILADQPPPPDFSTEPECAQRNLL